MTTYTPSLRPCSLARTKDPLNFYQNVPDLNRILITTECTNLVLEPYLNPLAKPLRHFKIRLRIGELFPLESMEPKSLASGSTTA